MKKTIKVSENTHNRLQKFGIKGETFDEVINRLLDELEDYRKKQ